MAVKKVPSVLEAKNKLWELGILDWKLTEVQKIIKKGILDDSNKINVVLCSRRLGKSYLMCILALEIAISTPGAIVKFVFPKQKDVKRNILPLMRQILEDCPEHVKPKYMEADKVMRSANGSEIQFAGSDNGNIESVRGGYAHLCIFDECGFASDVTYGVRSVLSPTTKTTGGRTIMVSTPSRSENHEFITDWVLPYQAENRVKVFTLYDNPNFTPAIIDEIIAEYPRGVEDRDFKREYLCEVTRGSDKSILPSFTSDIESSIVREDYPRPTHFDSYVSMDIGGSDLTAVVFGYYDYLNATTVIEDELIFSKDVNTKEVAEAVKQKERELWTNPIDRSAMPPYMRIADNNNLIMLTDMQRDHGLIFIPTRKDNREAAINSLDVAISQKKLVIHPRCTHTIYHTKFAEWNNTRSTFKKLKDSPTGKVKGGHCDALAALIYFYRNVIKSKNPYPHGYGHLEGANVYGSSRVPTQTDSSGLKDWMKNSFGWKRSKT